MPASSDEDEISTAGWDAISAALASIYPDQEPRHWGTLLSHRIGGPDPLDGISAYLHDDGQGASHWHFVTFGMSELYAKESGNKEVSGWGFEFTFRLKRDATQSEPPTWPLNMLNNLARYVFKSGNVFAPGHYLPLNGPIALGTQTAIHAAIFAEDSQLKQIDGPNGHVQFLQLTGLTLDELAAARAWKSEKLLELIRLKNPLLVTDLARQSILGDQTVASAVGAGIARDGSSTGWLAVRELGIAEGGNDSLKALTVIIGASSIPDIQALLRGRTVVGRDFRLVGPEITTIFSSAGKFAWTNNASEKSVKIDLSPAIAQALFSILKPRRGDYSLPNMPELTIRVVPSNIMDHTGKNVVEVIG
jgi:hypothetical protein